MTDSRRDIHLGVTFGFNRPRERWEADHVLTEFDRMAEIGVSSVCVVPTIMMETPTEPRQFADFEFTPSDLDLVAAIEAIHERGMKVHLRPMIESWDGHGRLQIWFPPDRPGTRIPDRHSTKWQTWWRGMRARTKHYAKIAQRYGCEMYGLDSEIDKFVHDNANWRDVLDAARSVYDGPVTSCHTHQVDFITELKKDDHWFGDLDCLGTSFYHPSANEPAVPMETRIAHLETRRDLYREIARLLGKPIMFGECGCTSSTGGAMHPSGWQGDGKYDPAEQADHLDAILRVFWDEPWWAGLYWWKWDENSVRPQFTDDPTGDKGFTIYGKPAADVFTKWAKRHNA